MQRLWQTSAPLTVTGLLMLAALAIAGLGLILDPRTITGAPAWLKPAKFAISIAIYVFTLAWVFTLLPEWEKTRRFVGWITAIVMILELVIIDLQAARGTTSHFNFGTPLDGVLFLVMGSAIVAQTLTSVAVAIALWRQRLQDPALGWAVRLGMTLTIIGALTGGLMTRPTEAQLARARAGQAMRVIGAHTVGAPDGGPGLAGTGWSTGHGDLRVPHFMGIHALQVLPLIALAADRRKWSAAARVRLTLTAAASYYALFGILLAQALRGQAVVATDAITMAIFGAWLLLTADLRVFVEHPFQADRNPRGHMKLPGTPEQVFSIANTVALVSWLLLAALPGRRWVTRVVTGGVVPALFAVLYAGLMVSLFRPTAGGFSSLAGVAALFSNPWLLLAGWVHYLAFDLLVGSWEVEDARECGVPYLLVLPCLFLTFMAGPAGWLLYRLVRVSRGRVDSGFGGGYHAM